MARAGASEEALDEDLDDEPKAKSGSKKIIVIVVLVFYPTRMIPIGLI